MERSFFRSSNTVLLQAAIVTERGSTTPFQKNTFVIARRCSLGVVEAAKPPRSFESGTCCNERSPNDARPQ